MLKTSTNHWIFSADIEAYGSMFYEKYKFIKGYAFLAKPLESKEGEVDDGDIFEINIVDFIYQLLDIKTELKLTNKSAYLIEKKWKKSSYRARKNNKNRTRSYFFERDFYFHNGAKYDLHFFLPVLKLIEKNDERIKLENVFFTKKNEILYLKLSFTDKNKIKRIINFKDSYRIFPVPLEKIGKSVKLPKLDYEDYDFLDEFKIKINYYLHNNGKSMRYFIRDVDILNRFFKKINNYFDLSKFKLTIAGTAYKEWFNTLHQNEKKNYRNREYFSKMPTNYFTEQWLISKLGYRGGWTYVSPKYQFKQLFKVYKYDMNSLYSSEMYNNVMPYGKVYKGDEPGTSYKELKVTIKEAKLNKTYWPFIPRPTKTSLEIDKIDDDYIAENQYPELLKNCSYIMNNYDYDWFSKSYSGDWEVEVLQSMFEKKSPFIDYIDYWMSIKEKAVKNEDDALKLFAKLMLNSLYGKFGQKIDIDLITSQVMSWEQAKERFIITDKSIRYETPKGNIRNVIKNQDTYVYVYDEEQIDIKKARHIAIASKITALARIRTLEAAHQNYDSFIYADTDSIHLTKPAKGIAIDKSKLGYWKFEGLVQRAIYRRPKHYLNYGIDDNSDKCDLWKLTGGGFNVRKINSKDFIKNMQEFAKNYFTKPEFEISDGKIISKIVDGGPLITNINYKFTMPSWWKDSE